MRKKRKEMGEQAWAEYQVKRTREKAKVWRAKNVDRVVNWRRKIKQILIEYKGGKCQRCGFNKDCASCYDFHHRDPNEKEFGISGKTKSIEKLKQEVDKCDLLCKNCHAQVHEFLYLEQKSFTIQKYESWLSNLGSA